MASGTLSDIATQLQVSSPGHTQFLIADMKELAELYRNVSGHRNLSVRLEKIITDSCRKFHVDCVDLRLLRTSVGPGVQWTGDEGRTV